jgi:ribonuclease BN (tRNA processing enzyme)
MGMIYFLGTGADYGTRFKEPVCVYFKSYINIGHANILFDCPPNILTQLDKMFISPTEIDAVFLSHQHWAHCSGIPSLLWANTVFGRRREFYIFGPDVREIEDIIRDFERHYPDEYTRRKKFEYKFIKLETEEGKVSEMDISKYFPGVENVILNYASLPHRGIKSSGYSLTFKNMEVGDGEFLKISYIVDAEVTDIESQLVSKSHIFIRDCSFEEEAKEWAKDSGHPTSSDVGKIAGNAKVRTLFLVHIHPTRQVLHLTNKIKEEVEKIISVSSPQTNVILPEDLEAFDINSLLPRRPLYSIKKPSIKEELKKK